MSNSGPIFNEKMVLKDTRLEPPRYDILLHNNIDLAVFLIGEPLT